METVISTTLQVIGAIMVALTARAFLATHWGREISSRFVGLGRFASDWWFLSNTFKTEKKINATNGLMTLINKRQSDRQFALLQAAIPLLSSAGVWMIGITFNLAGLVVHPFFWLCIGFSSFFLLCHALSIIDSSLNDNQIDSARKRLEQLQQEREKLKLRHKEYSAAPAENS